MNAGNTLKKLGIEKTFDYIYKDPDKHMPKMMDWADKFADGEFVTQRRMIREAITNPDITNIFAVFSRKLIPM